MRLIQPVALKGAADAESIAFAADKLEEAYQSLWWLMNDERREVAGTWFVGAVLAFTGSTLLLFGVLWGALLLPIGVGAVIWSVAVKATLRRWQWRLKEAERLIDTVKEEALEEVEERDLQRAIASGQNPFFSRRQPS